VASSAIACCRSRASIAPAIRRRSTSNHDSNSGHDSSSTPSSSSQLDVSNKSSSRRTSTVVASSPGDTGSPVSTSGTADRPAQLGQRPAECAERILGVREEQLGEPASAWGPLG
jgi:hypothetical protein